MQLPNTMQWSGGSQWDTSASRPGSALPQELTWSLQGPRGVPSHLDISISKLNYISIHRAVSAVLVQHRCSMLILSSLSSDFLSQKMQRSYVAEVITNARVSHGCCYFQDVSLRAFKNVSEHFVWAAVLTHCHRISSDDFLKQGFCFF